MIWNARNGQVPVGDTKMSYVSFGQGEKVLAVLPGLSDGLTTVDGKALLLAMPYRHFLDRYTVYMFSRKDEMPEQYSIREMAEDQADAMSALGIRKASVLGVSEGGMIAQYLAVDHAELVEKLVIAVSAPCVNEIIRESVTKWIEYANAENHKQLMVDTAERSYSEKYLKKYRKIYPLLGIIGKPKSYSRFLTNANATLSFDASDELEKIACPVLIIGGSGDRIVGADASREMNRRITNSELYIYQGLGHAAYEEAGDFYERVFSFLESQQDEKKL